MRELVLLRDEGLIKVTSRAHYADRDAMDVHDLTPAGRSRLEELRQRYRGRVRWLKQYWPVAERWLLATAVPIAVGVCTAAIVVWLSLS